MMNRAVVVVKYHYGGCQLNAKCASTRKCLKGLGNLRSSAVYNQGRLTLFFDTIPCGLQSRVANNRINTVFRKKRQKNARLMDDALKTSGIKY